MKKLLLFPLIIYMFLIFFSLPVNAISKFDMNMNDFYKKQQIASTLLKGIEMDLKDGSRDNVCARQKEAAKYGIEATESLIKAFKLNGSTSQIENVQAGLNKWKELRDYC